MLSDLNDSGSVGGGWGGSTLCALYCVLFLTPRRWQLLTLLLIVVSEFGIFSYPLDPNREVADVLSELWGNANHQYVLRMLAICCAGLFAGAARFGFHGLGKCALSIGTGAFLICILHSLVNARTLDGIGSSLLIGIEGMALATAASCGTCAASRVARRIDS
ncbi:MAG: hypothetical protein QGG73_06420 [Candidatus Hydrogenedentes bacterium]|nr:hypothetical protein [Candidatus Hydrogenedentota bacterium]